MKRWKCLICFFLCFAAANVWAGKKEGGQAFLKGDYATALKELRPLAERGDADVQLVLGGMYEAGQGVPRDKAEALKWYRLAADQGLASAQYAAGLMYYGDSAGGQRNYAEAERWFRRAADKGDADAQLMLGLMSSLGEGLPQDYAEAVKWYRLSAAQGNARALQALGVMFTTGFGVPEDNVTAYALFGLSLRSSSSGSNAATVSRPILAAKLSVQEIELAERLVQEMTTPGNFIPALDTRLASLGRK